MSLGTWGESQLTDSFSGFFGNPYLRDYTHAARTFLPDSYALSPKLKFLFHVVFNINPQVYVENTDISVLVKSVQLPNINFDVATYNQYNRKRLVQTKVKYDPVQITFHDDHLNTISGLWYQYFTYYYKDASNPNVIFNGVRGNTPINDYNAGGTNSQKSDAVYNDRTQYQPSITDYTDWGYIGDGTQPTSANPRKIPFFDNITVFGLGRHNFSSYTLINPIITRWGQDTYDYEQGNGTMSANMTIDYETVVYRQGAIDGTNPGNVIKGFGDPMYYDTNVSPIAIPGSNAKIIGQGGLIDAAGGIVGDLSNGAAGVLNAVRTAGVTYNTFKNVDLNDVLQGEITKGLNTVLQSGNNPTRNNQFDIPVYGASSTGVGTAGTPSLTQQGPIPIGPNPNAGLQNPNPYTGINSQVLP